ncbi:unnamed protein product [Paramecium primaurelia]|uniref:Uncharacterized protein n=1 Tax=Paramecium primaurelia TaxID=5886 RepID=A0A8S1QEI4_PARPR|nr:unnamed protein product [Paramecium primaurelia]
MKGPSSDTFKDLDSQLLFIKDAILQNLQNQDYQELEKQVQKYESEIRKHIRTEQQIKLYCEQLQQQLEQFQQNNINKNLIHQLKKEITILNEQNKHLIEENTFLKKKIQENNEIQQHQTISSKQPLKLVDFIRKQKLPIDKESYLSNTIDTCSILKKEQNRLHQKTISQQITEQNYDHCKQFINNFNIICNKQKITCNINRQKKSISEHKQIKHKLDLSSIN